MNGTGHRKGENLLAGGRKAFDGFFKNISVICFCVSFYTVGRQQDLQREEAHSGNQVATLKDMAAAEPCRQQWMMQMMQGVWA